MKTLLLFALLFQAGGNISYVYPVRIEVVQSGKYFLGRGSGRGNIHDATFGVRGFDYVFQGCREIGTTGASERQMAPARWKSAQELVILTAAPGTPRAECTVRGNLRDFVYILDKTGHIDTRPVPTQKK